MESLTSHRVRMQVFCFVFANIVFNCELLLVMVQIFVSNHH